MAPPPPDRSAGAGDRARTSAAEANGVGTRASRRRGVGRVGTKLALATALVLALVSTLLFVELTGRERQGLLRAKRTAATMVADLFAASLSAPLDFGDAEAIDAELSHLATNPDITCADVWSGDGASPPRVGRLARGGCEGVASPRADAVEVRDDRVIVSRVVHGRAGASVGKSAIVGKTAIVFTLAPENAVYRESQRRIFLVSFALAAVTTGLLLTLARRLVVAPVAQLGQAARRIGRGDFSAKVTIASRDEMGELADAFNAMSDRLADRERRLAAATESLRDLFDHMRQAILAFGPDGKVQGEVSRAARAIFGRDALEGASIQELLYGGAAAHDVDAQAFAEWLGMAFQLPLDQWSELSSLAPQEVVIARGRDAVPLELEFRPIVKRGDDAATIERVMLLATDVSDKRALEATVQTQEEEHARRMAAMRRLIAGGGQVFVAFMDAARERLARCDEIVGRDVRKLTTAEIDELFRHVHTIKGEARAFDLRELEAETAKLEEELDELRAAARGDGFATTGSVHGLLVARLSRTREAIDHGADVFVAASPIGRAALDQVTVQRQDVQELLAMAGGRDDALGRLAARLASRPFGESTASLVDMAPTWGDKEGKKVHLDVEGRELRVPPQLARVLGAVLTHLVRNAVAHGIEPPDVREELGKPREGTIRIDAREGARGPVIVVEDDGRGLDEARIRERARALGIDGERSDVGELVFTSGLTTIESAGALAGRGVGLGAVRADLARAGYAIDVTSREGSFTRFTLRPRTPEDTTVSAPAG